MSNAPRSRPPSHTTARKLKTADDPIADGPTADEPDAEPTVVGTMSPLEAAQLLYRMADAAPGNGADHRLKEQAAQVLAALLSPSVDSP